VIENNGIGLNIFSNGAVNGTFRSNDVRNNSRYNLDLNSAVYDFLDMDTTNLVDGKPVYFWLRRLDETVPSNAGQVTLVNCSNILVQSLDLEKNSVNVQFVKSYNCTLQVSNLSYADVGVLMVDSRNCNVINNTLSDCRIDLQVQGSMNNTFTGNYLWINDFCGIDFGSTANNSFYHNTLNNLGATYIVYRAGLNIWDNGYPSGGNFWSDYVGVDFKNGPNQDIDGSDQIGDTPYIIDANNSDHYPLVAARSPTSVHNVDSGLDYESIQSAIDAQETLNGHTILVDAGTYYEDLTLSKSVSLVGEGSINTIIDGSSSGAVINITASSVNLTGFTITNSGAGYPSGGVLVYSSNNTISHNRIESNNGSGIYLFATSYGNNISNNEVLNNTGTGIYILSSSNTLTGNEIAGNHYYGLSLHSANNNTITDNGIVANGQYGISLRSSCENILKNNDILDNDEGIFMWFSSCNNTLAENKIVGNSFHGVWLDFSSGNILEGNDISGNGGGLWLQYSSSSNSLIENNITDNHDLGLGLDTSSYNIIYHNNFMNSVNVVATQGLVNIWDNGYPAGGNYWNGFTGNDSGSGLFQNETGSDGVIDIANIIDVNNRDLFPLTKPYSNQFDIGITQIEVSEHRMGHLRLPVSAKIINYGQQTESFNVSLMANSTRMQTQTIMVPSRNSTIVMFVWNVTKAARGNYSIAVIASSLQGETDTRDNELAMEALFFVTAPGDVAGPANVSDGIVNMDDLAAIVMKFNARAASSRWNVDLDVNDDGVINMRDISIAILNLDRP
jgi:parallel beta-helix repeat protein